MDNVIELNRPPVVPNGGIKLPKKDSNLKPFNPVKIDFVQRSVAAMAERQIVNIETTELGDGYFNIQFWSYDQGDLTREVALQRKIYGSRIERENNDRGFELYPTHNFIIKP